MDSFKDQSLDALDQLQVAAGGHGRISPSDGTKGYIAGQRYGFALHVSPIVAVPVLAGIALLALRRQSMTPAALLLMLAAGAAQIFDIWPAFFLLYSTFFLITSLVKPRGQTSASFVLASALIGTALPAVFTYALPTRLYQIALFLLNSRPAVCLPRPSQTLEYSENYTILVAMYGQIPYAVAVSYSAAAALAFSSRLRSQMPAILAAMAGALTMAAAAATTLPLCDKVKHGSSKPIMDHIDGRSTAWGKRGPIYWEHFERYAIFIPAVALCGVAAWVLASVLDNNKPSAVKVSKGGSDEAEELVTAEDAGYARQLLANALVSGSVLLGMALWSTIGNVEEE